MSSLDRVFYGGFDFLRTVSVLAVFVFHAKASLLPGGFLGVDLFFVISGFLMAEVLNRELRRDGMISGIAFFRKRVQRLYPPLIFALILFLIYSFIYQNSDAFSNNLFDAYITLTNQSNWYRAFEMGRPAYLAHTWSLSAEWQLYVIIYLLFWLLGDFNKVALISFLTLVVIGIYRTISIVYLDPSIDRVYNGLDFHSDSFFIGICLYWFFANKQPFLQRLPQSIWTVLFAFSLVSVFLYFLIPKLGELNFFGFPYLLFSFLSSTLILSSVNVTGPIATLLNCKPILFFGILSYAFYIFHYPVLGFMKYQGYTDLSWRLGVASLVTFFLSLLSYFLVERFFSSKQLTQRTIL